MERHFWGQVSTQELQTMQRKRSICQVFATLSSTMAWAGHFRWQMLQEMHLLPSKTTCPREIGVLFAASTG
jgi:hypothetical protein